MKFIFLGPPGAGKGTCAREAAKALEIGHLSTGEYFRELVAKGDAKGIYWKTQFWDKGKLVPDKETIEVVFEKLKGPGFGKGYILDGFPRTTNQAESLYDCGVDIDRVLNFKIANDELIKRISNRMTCRGCNASYNLISAKPAAEGKCDSCSGELYQRDDEKPEVFRERLTVYERDTVQLIKYYRVRGLLAEIDASQGIEKVLADTLEALR